MNPRRHTASGRRLLSLFAILAALLPVVSLAPFLMLAPASDLLAAPPEGAPGGSALGYMLRLWPWLVVPLGGSVLLALAALLLVRQLGRPFAALERDLANLVSRQGAGPLAADYGLSELDALLQHVNQLCAARASLAHNVERLNERLVQAQTLAALGQVAVGVAHDLNNPLTTIMGLADIIQTTDPDPDTQRDIVVIHRQAERSGRLVRTLLGFARRQREEPQWVSLNTLISQALELLAYQARIGNIRCETHLDGSLPLTWADPSPMQQVLFNLISNAMQAMAGAHGQGNLIVESSWSPPVQDAPYGCITIRVRDDGPGIPEDSLPRLFQPYYTTKGPSGGTGLGLWMSADIVKRHGGRIWAENNPRGGACFSVRLPVTPEPSQPAPAQPASGVVPGSRHILLADGDPERLGLFSRILRRQGYRVSTAGDGLLARSRLELEPYDLVLCGLELTRLSGRELHAWARTNRPEMAARFVFIASAPVSPEVQAFLQAAHAPVLAPPFLEDAIRQTIGQALRPGSTGIELQPREPDGRES